MRKNHHFKRRAVEKREFGNLLHPLGNNYRTGSEKTADERAFVDFFYSARRSCLRGARWAKARSEVVKC